MPLYLQKQEPKKKKIYLCIQKSEMNDDSETPEQRQKRRLREHERRTRTPVYTPPSYEDQRQMMESFEREHIHTVLSPRVDQLIRDPSLPRTIGPRKRAPTPPSPVRLDPKLRALTAFYAPRSPPPPVPKQTSTASRTTTVADVTRGILSDIKKVRELPPSRGGRREELPPPLSRGRFPPPDRREKQPKARPKKIPVKSRDTAMDDGSDSSLEEGEVRDVSLESVESVVVEKKPRSRKRQKYEDFKRRSDLRERVLLLKEAPQKELMERVNEHQPHPVKKNFNNFEESTLILIENYLLEYDEMQIRVNEAAKNLPSHLKSQINMYIAREMQYAKPGDYSTLTLSDLKKLLELIQALQKPMEEFEVKRERSPDREQLLLEIYERAQALLPTPYKELWAFIQQDQPTETIDLETLDQYTINQVIRYFNTRQRLQDEFVELLKILNEEEQEELFAILNDRKKVKQTTWDDREDAVSSMTNSTLAIIVNEGREMLRRRPEKERQTKPRRVDQDKKELKVTKKTRRRGRPRVVQQEEEDDDEEEREQEADMKPRQRRGAVKKPATTKRAKKPASAKLTKEKEGKETGSGKKKKVAPKRKLTIEEMKQLGEITKKKTEDAIRELQNELKRMSGKVVEKDYGGGSDIEDYRSEYTLEPLLDEEEESSLSTESESGVVFPKYKTTK